MDYIPQLKVGDKKIIYMDFMNRRRPYGTMAILKRFVRFDSRLNLESWEVSFLDSRGDETKELSTVPIKIVCDYPQTQSEVKIPQIDLKEIVDKAKFVKPIKRGRGRPKGSKNIKKNNF